MVKYGICKACLYRYKCGIMKLLACPGYELDELGNPQDTDSRVVSEAIDYGRSMAGAAQLPKLPKGVINERYRDGTA